MPINFRALDPDIFIDRALTGWYYASDSGVLPDVAADQSAALNQAVANTPTDGTLLLPPGDIYVGSGWLVDKSIALHGLGLELKTRIVAMSGATSPIVSINPAVKTKHIELQDLGIDATLAPGATCLYINHADVSRFRRIKTRGGAVGIQIDDVSASLFDDLNAFNQSLAGIQTIATVTRPIGNNFQDCLVYQTSGATTSMVAAFDITAGEDFQFINCRALRTPGSAYDMAYGIRVMYTNPNTNSYIFMVNCEFDGIDGDRVASSNNGAAAYFKNAKGLRIENSWFSAFDPSTPGTPKQPGIMIEGGTQHTFVGNWISGTGVRFIGAPDLAIFFANQFAQAGGDNAWTLAPAAAPTKLFIGPQSYAFPSVLGTAADLATLANSSVPLGLTPPAFATTDTGTGGAGLLRLYNPTTGKSKWVRISSDAGGTFQILSDDRSTVIFSISNTGGIGVPNSAAATGPVGAVTGKLQIFNAAGASLGYIPIYNAIT